jgi:hypothetical protein
MPRELPEHVLREREARKARIAALTEQIAETDAFIAQMEAGYFVNH